jgi:hypothetical protein
VCVCRAAAALRPSGMTHSPLFYVVGPNTSDYANMLIRPSGMMHLICFQTIRSAKSYSSMMVPETKRSAKYNISV